MKKKIAIAALVIYFLAFVFQSKTENKEHKTMEEDGLNLTYDILFEKNTPISNPEIHNNLLDEDEFKNFCSEIIYNNISEQSVGEYVYKDLFNWKINESGDRYLCSAIEDFLEDLKVFQKTYKNYEIIDCRIDNSFPIENSDIIRVYGVVDSVSQSYFTGGYNPTIKMYYIEYIRKYGKEPENKAIEEIREERILERK